MGLAPISAIVDVAIPTPQLDVCRCKNQISMPTILLIDTLDMVLPGRARSLSVGGSFAKNPAGQPPPTLSGYFLHAPQGRGREGSDRPMLSDLVSPGPVVVEKWWQRFLARLGRLGTC